MVLCNDGVATHCRARRPANFATRNVFCSLLIKFNCNSSLCTRQVRSYDTKVSNVYGAKFVRCQEKEKKIKADEIGILSSATPQTHSHSHLVPVAAVTSSNELQEYKCCIMNCRSLIPVALHIHPKACGCKRPFQVERTSNETKIACDVPFESDQKIYCDQFPVRCLFFRRLYMCVRAECVYDAFTYT